MNDLRDLLNDTAGATTTLDANEVGTSAAPVAVSNTVLKLDKWGVRRGEQLAQEWHDAEVADVADDLAADAHGSLFEADPVLADRPADAHRAEWFKQLMQTPEYASLHRHTVHDSELSALAAKNLCNEFEEYARQNPPARKDEAAPGSDGESIAAQVARIRSTGKALEHASEEVHGMQDTASGLGIGEGGSVDRQQLAAAFKRVRNSDLLRKVMEMAGRMRARCRSLQQQKLHAKRGEITGIELGGDLGRLVARERLALAGAIGPELQEMAEYRLLKRRALCYRQKLNTKVAGGPIIVSVDESGSMSGEKIVAAKALALTLAWLAGQQNRWIALVGYSGKDDGHSVAFAPGYRNPEELIKWVEHFFSGGTSCDCPCEIVPDAYPRWLGQGLKEGQADHIIITDAIVHAPDALCDAYNKWAGGAKVKTYGIVVGETEPGYLGSVAQRSWCLPKLTVDAAAVEEVLSI